MLKPSPSRPVGQFKTYWLLLPLGLLVLVGLAGIGWVANQPVFGADEFICEQDQMTDIDGNSYSTVKIGDQCWTQEYLRTTRFADGQDIPRPLSNNDWREAGNNRAGAYACYDNDLENCEIYGALYNSYAVDRGLCPDGWQVPSDEDFKELEINIGLDPDQVDWLYWRGDPYGITLAGHYDLWEPDGFRDEPEFGQSGFDAAPAGYRMSGGSYSWLGYRANIWSSTIQASAWRRTIISTSSGGIRRTAAAKNFGFSVRCLKK